MHRWIMSLCLVALFLMILPYPVLGATAKQTVEEKVGRIISILGRADFKQQPKDVQVSRIRAIVGEIFDYEELSRRCLGAGWKKLNGEQQKEFILLFSDLLAKTYADRLLAYTSERVEFEKEDDPGDGRVEVQSTILTTDGKKATLDYRMI